MQLKIRTIRVFEKCILSFASLNIKVYIMRSYTVINQKVLTQILTVLILEHKHVDLINCCDSQNVHCRLEYRVK